MRRKDFTGFYSYTRVVYALHSFATIKIGRQSSTKIHLCFLCRVQFD